ncbi:MAG: alpha/beta fold hydrolase [Bacteroidales bacterium]
MQTEINGHIINYKLLNKQFFDNENPVLVFLHEGLGSIAQWKLIPQKISDALNLAGIIYDRIGYGLSSERKKVLNTDYLHDEALIYLPELLINLNIHQKVILIGHSDGATISLLFASFFPDKTAGVISEAAHVIIEDLTVNGINNLKTAFSKNPALMKSLQKYHGEKTEKLFNEWIALWLTNEIKTWNIEIELRNVQTNILAIQGDKDEFGSYKQLETIKNLVNSDVEIQFIPNCGHIPHFEKETEVLKRIIGFVNKVYIKKT